MSTETIQTIRTSTSTLTQVLSSEVSTVSVRVQCCFTSTETVQTIRNGEPRASTSTLTQVLSSEVSTEFEFSVALRPPDRKVYYERGA